MSLDKNGLEESVRMAINPAQGDIHTIVSALSNILPFGWNWVADGPNGRLQITSEVVDIQIYGRECVFNWKN